MNGNRYQRRGGVELLETRRLLTIDLSVAFTDVAESMVLGEETAYEFRVSNTGNEIAQCVVVEHAPQGLSDMAWVRTHAFRPILDIDELDGNDGFSLAGKTGREYQTLHAQIVGDINDDGIDDLLVSIFPPRWIAPDTVAVVFGGPEVGESGHLPELSSYLDGNNGFFIRQALADDVARSGDVNGDGIDDLFLRSADESNDHYVVFGRTDWSDQASIGIEAISDSLKLVSDTLDSMQPAGDINGDGIHDIALLTQTDQGKLVQVLLGENNFAETKVILLEHLDEKIEVDRFVESVEAAGDFNGDGFDDLLISGESYRGVWLAKGVSLSSTVHTFQTEAIAEVDGSEIRGSAVGDVNGDGYDDIITRNGDDHRILFGYEESTESGRSADLTNMLNARTLQQAGDINSDGIDDLIIGSYDSATILFGSEQMAEQKEIDVLDVDVDNFRVIRRPRFDTDGFVRSAFGKGDLNGDGVDDFVLGGGNYADGEPEAHVIFGQPQANGRERIRNNVSIRPGEVVLFTVAGIVAPNLQEFSATASATDCWESRHRPELNLDVEIIRPNQQITGESGTYEIRVTNDNDKSPVMATIDSELSNWLTAPGWHQTVGVTPMLDIAAVEATAIFSYFETVKEAGDVNGDGLQDLVITTGIRDASGRDHYLKLGGESAAQFFLPNASLSSSLHGVGDLNGDGFDDLVLSRFELPPLVFLGGAIVDSQSDTSIADLDDSSFNTIIGFGDVNGDGLSDVLTKHPLGITYGVSDTDNISLSTLKVPVEVSDTGSRDQVWLNGDINGDGFDDIVVSDENSNSVYWGGSSLQTETPQKLLIHGALDMVPIGDVDGDGNVDLFVTKKTGGRERGGILLGGSHLSSTDELNVADGSTLDTVLLADWHLEFVKGLGDFNHDGFDDFMVGPKELSASEYVLFGGPTFIGSGQFDLLSLNGRNGFELYRPDGSSRSPLIAAAGDTNGDGVDDFTTRTINVPGLTKVVTVFGQDMTDEGIGNLQDHRFELAPGATASFLVSGLLRAAETGLSATITSCQCVDQSESNLGNNSAEISTDVRASALPGDVNDDGMVSFADFLVLSANFGRISNVSRALGDLDRDGSVGFSDFLVLVANFGELRVV